MAFLQLLGNKFKAGGYVGWAQARLAQLRQHLSINGLKQGFRRYCLPDGTNILVSKNYRNELIQIDAGAREPIPLLFLVGSMVDYGEDARTQYACWSLSKQEDGTPVFTLIAFDISRVVIFHDSSLEPRWTYPPLHPSSVQSNLALREHHVLLENMTGQGAPINRQYGVVTDELFGMENSYLPQFYDLEDVEIFDEGFFGSSAYMCSGRHNWMADPSREGKVIKELCIVNIGGGEGQVNWNSEEGVEQGVKFPYSLTTDFIAILNPTKFVGVDRAGFARANWTIATSILTHGCAKVGEEEWTPYKILVYSMWDFGASLYPFKFGDVVLEYFGKTQEIWVNPASSMSYCCYRGGCAADYQSQVTYGWTWERRRTIENGKVYIQDYDNLDHDDQTFVCFYFIEGDDYSMSESWTTMPFQLKYYNGWWLNGGVGKYHRTFCLAYRINGGELQKVFISNIGEDADYYERGGADKYESFVCCFEGPSETPSIYRDFVLQSSGKTAGSRVRFPTCKISGDFILYSYILEDFTGAGDPGLDDLTSSNWSFDKRIMGAIDIATGERTEHEVDDTFLGDLYKDTFNEEKAAAVGLHNL